MASNEKVTEALTAGLKNKLSRLAETSRTRVNQNAVSVAVSLANASQTNVSTNPIKQQKGFSQSSITNPETTQKSFDFRKEFHQGLLLMRTVSLLEKQHQHVKFINLSSYFSSWKLLNIKSNQFGSFESSDPSNPKTSLSLFNEIEGLREALHRTSQLNSTLKQKGFFYLLIIFIRSRIRAKKQSAFEHWVYQTRQSNRIQAVNRQALQLSIGLQHVNRKQENLQKEESSTLRTNQSMVMTLCFFKWKARILEQSLQSERTRHKQHSTRILREVRELKELTLRVNQQETSLLGLGVERGRKAIGDLSLSLSNMNRAVENYQSEEREREREKQKKERDKRIGSSSSISPSPTMSRSHLENND